METDVVVVGSGGAGLVAALHAASRGARVTVLEKAPVFGGTTSMSGGSHWLPGNPLGAKAFGLQDSSADAERYLDALSLGRVPKTVHAFVREAPAYFDFLAANTGCQFEAANIPDSYRGVPGSKGPGRVITTGSFDTSRLGEYRQLLRVAPRGAVNKAPQDQHENVVGHLDAGALAARAAERRQKGIAVRGQALVGGLMEACLKHKVQLVHSARATELTQDNGRVTGVRALREGKTETYSARRGVVLTSGGFEWNRLMWNSLIGVPWDGAKSPPFNEGDGLRMALSVGAQLRNMDQVWWSLAVQIPGETYDGQQLTRGAGIEHGRPGSITVNRRGRRFMNENVISYDAGYPMVRFDQQRHEFPNYPAFVVMDRQMYELEPVADDVDETAFPRSSWLHEAPTLHALAERIGVDADGLADQVKEWNRSCENGRDPDFHRGEFEYDNTREPWEKYRSDTSTGLKNPLLRPIGAGPYYAVQLKSTCFGTKGGAVIDEDARVCGFNDKPIPGLFAAGNVTACAYGVASPGGGSSIPPAMVFGWVAGRSVSA